MFRTVSKYDFVITEKDFQDRVQELLFLEQHALEDSTLASLNSHKRCYSIFCRSVGVRAFPVSYLSLGLFLVQYCRWFGHTARSIPTILSHLKRVNRAYFSQWLDRESACSQDI